MPNLPIPKGPSNYIPCTDNMKLTTITLAMSIEQYHNQRCHRERSFNPKGQGLQRKEKQHAIFVKVLFYIQCVAAPLGQPTVCITSYQLPLVLYVPLPRVLRFLTLHPSFHPAIMPPTIKSHQNSNFTSSQAGFYTSSSERPKSSPYLYGHYTVCMRVKTMGLVQ